MKILNRKAEVGLNLLQILAQEGGVHRADVLADRLGESELFVFRILHELKAGGFVQSFRGPGGGYKFQAGAETCSLLKYLEHFNRDFAANPLHRRGSASETAKGAMIQALIDAKLTHVLKLIPQPEPPTAA